MVRRIGLLASFFVILQATIASLPVLSEASFKPTRITSYETNITLGKVIFSTTGSAIAAPRIHYLPGANGQMLLLADFSNLFYPFPPQSIQAARKSPSASSHRQAGVESISFGQIQTIPPIFRITIGAKCLETLKAIAFEAHCAHLSMTWPAAGDAANYPRSDPGLTVPPDRLSQIEQPLPNRLMDNEKPQAPLKLVFSTEQFDCAAQGNVVALGNPSAGALAKQTNGEPLASSAPLAEPSIDGESKGSDQLPLPMILPKIEIAFPQKRPETEAAQIGSNIGQVRIIGNQKLAVTSFRLHNPERYIVDFDNLPLLSNAQLPVWQSATPFKTVRIGTPKGKPKTSRLVFDLTGLDCLVHSELASAASQLVLTFSRAVDTSEAALLPAGMQVVLDPGHGGSDPGARRNGIEEKELTLSIVNALRQKLEHKGIKVMLTRSNDAFVSLEDRVKLTNSIAPTLFLSIHINSLGVDSDIKGIETYYQTGQSKPLADAIQDCLVNNLEVPDRYVRRAHFYVINHTPIPAVLAEVGFISSKEERDRLISFDYQNRIAKALEQGVILYLIRQDQLAQAGATLSHLGGLARQRF